MKSSVKTRYAECLDDIYEHIFDMFSEIENPENPNPVFWFRGHSKASYNLEPNLFRQNAYIYNNQKTYSNNHLREEYRFQSFMSRNYDNIDSHMPQYMIEWEGVMQHYFTKTRLMDWSESLTVALEFALESFIDPISDLENKNRRLTATPTIWILQPDKINQQVYSSFIKADNSLISRALGQASTDPLPNLIFNELKKEENSGIYFNLKNINEKNLNSMIGLSALELIRNAYRGRELQALESFEMNPFFYLLLRYYSDGLPVEMGKLPPLAIIHPYHSQRIKIQKGVFTVFPFYIPNKEMEEICSVRENFQPSIGMEYMPQCEPYLHCIQITNPEKVARQLISTGAKRENLYPDTQIVSQDIENVIHFS